MYMINSFQLHGRVLREPEWKSYSVVLGIASKSDRVKGTDLNGNILYEEDFVDVHFKDKGTIDYMYKVGYVGQMVFLTGYIGRIGGNTVVIADKYYRLTDKNGWLK